MGRPRLPAFSAALAIAALAWSGSAPADPGNTTRLVYKSAESGSSYHEMGLQLAAAVATGTDGALALTVEESAGSVSNVREAPLRGAGYVFTAPPGLVAAARRNGGAFADGRDYDGIRALFVLPALTMHFVVRAEAGIAAFDDLAGRTFAVGKGSFGAREAVRSFELFGVAERVELVDIGLDVAVPAFVNGQVDGFATAGSYPAPNVARAAEAADIALLSMTPDQVAVTGRTRLAIPGGTYAGVPGETITTAVPVGVYTTAATDTAAARRLTRAFWRARPGLAERAPWWAGVSPAMLEQLSGPLHAGARRHYETAGVDLPAGLE